MKRKIVYIAHALTATTHEERVLNLRTASEIATRFSKELKIAPICTWIVLASIWTEDERELGLAIDKRLIEVCEELWVCGVRVSAGMQIEVDHARSLGIPVIDMRFAHLYADCKPRGLTLNF